MLSWPARGAHGPCWPQPVMRPYTSAGRRCRHTSGPRPRRSITPGRMPSISRSASSHSRNTASTATGSLRFSTTDCLPRLVMAWGRSGAARRSGGSTAMTVAPRSASSMPQNGPGPMPLISITLTPASGPMLVLLVEMDGMERQDLRKTLFAKSYKLTDHMVSKLRKKHDDRRDKLPDRKTHPLWLGRPSDPFSQGSPLHRVQ
ncbi:hypothetical protein CO2235_MP10298 [Cupriavidus oxalaticus]|uniref:Uncharacterized protein n=1 Tax=Cupriavidus oxalaticus TaxID=96344 RepID=A0A375GHN1_9BURK|nr:hypothetical protein CO2235_U1010134 [Cupriavidus oxalaticus]SPC18017.1 hypothetical protein CO2235_MP10298 [Cupriavidus oxalaticus]